LSSANCWGFAPSEARIARAAIESGFDRRKPHFQDDSVVEYEGFSGYPSFCQVAHRKRQGRVPFALIHMPHGGASPTNMFESLATHFRQQFYPKVDPGLIDWFDVVPPDAYDPGSWPRKITINPITLLHANGVYRNPEWDNGDNLPQDWIDFVAGVIDRSRKVREHLEAAPHQLENA
jgi:hypothetical protein